MSDHPIGVMIADDSSVFRSGLRHLVRADTKLKVIGEAAAGGQVAAMARELRPDVLLMDMGLPDWTAIEEQLTDFPEATRILLMGDSLIERQRLIRVLQMGARGFITKNADSAVFLKAIHCVSRGEFWVERDVLSEWARISDRASRTKMRLTAREREIVQQILEGSSNRDIAAKLAITEHTVKRHLTNIYDKLGCSTRLELSLFAVYHRF